MCCLTEAKWAPLDRQTTLHRLGWTFLACLCLTLFYKFLPNPSPLIFVLSLLPLTWPVPFILPHFSVPFRYIFVFLLSHQHLTNPFRIKCQKWKYYSPLSHYLLMPLSLFLFSSVWVLNRKGRNHLLIHLNTVPKARVLLLRNGRKFFSFSKTRSNGIRNFMWSIRKHFLTGG